MSELSSYPKVHNINHRLADNLFAGEIVVQEKVDGSQFSFSVNTIGEVSCRSRGMALDVNAPEKLFRLAVETVARAARKLIPEWVYRGEAITSLRHNVLTYGRVPEGNVIIFDVEVSPGKFLNPTQLREHCQLIGLECVPLFYYGPGDAFKHDLESWLGRLLNKTSILETEKVEGIVIKNYDQYGPDDKVLMGKVVRPEFKEIHKKVWGESNPSQGDFIQGLIAKYRTSARWDKAIQHLREAGQLKDEPADIAILIKEIPIDVNLECGNQIVADLMGHFWPQISRGLLRGFAEYYKERLLKDALEGKDDGPTEPATNPVEPDITTPVSTVQAQPTDT